MTHPRLRVLLLAATVLVPAFSTAKAAVTSLDLASTAPMSTSLSTPAANTTTLDQPGKPRARDSRGRYVGKRRKGKARFSAACKDGTIWFGYVRPGACGRHGGVAKWK